jgi:hypothetical protein
MSVTTSTPTTLGLKALAGADPRRDVPRGRTGCVFTAAMRDDLHALGVATPIAEGVRS